MEAGARTLFRSLQRFKQLPDYLQIWPGHGAGSACGKALGAVPQSTLGYERRTNWALRITDEAEFVARVLAGQPEPPAYFARMKRLNAAGVPEAPSPQSAREEALRDAIARGALAVDVRSASEFAAGHLRGSINVPLGSSFLGWAGSVVPPERDAVLVATPALRADADAAQRELRLIGLDHVIGVLAPPRLEASEAGALATLPSVPANTLADEARGGATVLDVRNRSEWEQGHVPGARLVPLPELAARIEELRGAGRIAVHCQGGSRSAVAASVLRAEGFADVANVDGGFVAWLRAGNTPATGA